MTHEEKLMLGRLRYTVGKLAGWNGISISELIEDGLLEEGDIV